jgi:hypothetical protein
VVAFGPVLRTGALLGLITLAMGAPPARANPASLVASAVDDGDPADLYLRIDYDYAVDTANLWREVVGAPIDPLDPIPRVSDLSFKQFRHRILPRADLGIYHNTSISVALPIVIQQQRELRLRPGVSREGSSTVADGLLPPEGFDARDPGTPLTSDLMFRGASRSGLDQVHTGLTFALMNQEKDETKPTWKLGGELRIPVGRAMRFDSVDPGSETDVSRGLYEVRVWTSFARRYKRTEAWFELHWMAPVAEKDTSLLHLPESQRFGATRIKPSQEGGVASGIEVYFVDDRTTGNRIGLDLGARVDAHFEGRGYSEMWEVFAYAGDANMPGRPLVLDGDPATPDLQARSYPGVSNIENYLEMSGRAALRAQLGRYVRFAATVDLVWKTDHVITLADAGVDLPTCGAGVTGPCENENNGVVNPNTREVNPLHVPIIDLVGHRYHSEDNFGYVIGVQGQLLF